MYVQPCAMHFSNAFFFFSITSRIITSNLTVSNTFVAYFPFSLTCRHFIFL